MAGVPVWIVFFVVVVLFLVFFGVTKEHLEENFVENEILVRKSKTVRSLFRTLICFAIGSSRLQ